MPATTPVHTPPVVDQLYGKILVCLDGTLGSEAVLPQVEKLLRARPDAFVVLLTVGEPIDVANAVREISMGYAYVADDIEAEVAALTSSAEKQIRAYLGKVAARLGTIGGTFALEVSFHEPASEILHFARFHAVDLIMMATHGRRGLSRLLYGSVTESVVEQAQCPVLVVHTAIGAPPDSKAASKTAVPPPAPAPSAPPAQTGTAQGMDQ
jgi:nucleotide-binding universal stress UspA family protein